MAQVKYRRPLQGYQLEILFWLYRYRFSLCSQITMGIGGVDYAGMQKRLRTLEAQGFIGKRYDRSYKFAGRPAEYYLHPKGARHLRQYQEYVDSIDERIIKLLYQNKKVSDAFVNQCICIMDIILKLRAWYSDLSSVATQADMVKNIHLPRWRPNVYISREKGGYSYFLDIEHEDTPFFVLVRKARSYLKYIEETWLPDAIPRPTFLFICATASSKGKFRKQIERALEDFYDPETVFAITTRQQFENAVSSKDKIWEKITLNDEPTMMALPILP